MKLLPVYLNCVLKSDVLLPGADVSLDDRAYLRQLISCMDVAETHVFFYPRLLPLVSARTRTHTVSSVLLFSYCRPEQICDCLLLDNRSCVSITFRIAQDINITIKNWYWKHINKAATILE